MASKEKKFFLVKIFPSLETVLINSEEMRDLQYLRGTLVDFIFSVFAFIGIFAYIPSVYLAITDGFWDFILVSTIIYGWVLRIHFSKNFSLFFKTGFLLVACYLIGLALLFIIDADYSLSWFFSVPIIAAVLLGFRSAIVTLIINFFVMSLAGYSIHTGVVYWSNVEESLMSGWFILSVSFMLLNSITSVSISILFEQLRRSLDNTISANKFLYEERKTLTHEIQQRIHAEHEKDAIQKKLQQSEKLEAIGMMAGGVAHDLNNILSGVINYPELMLLKLPEDSELREPLTAVIKSGNRAASLVSDLLTVSSGAASPKYPYNLNEIVDEYLDSQEASNLKDRYPEITIAKELNADLQNILCSRIHIFKCIMNLVINGAEAIEGQGTILIKTTNEIADHASESTDDCARSFVKLEVYDSGKGISEDDLKRIFEPFYTRKVMGVGGTGLGLTIVSNTVQDHGGHIAVSSNVASGTCFQLSFPVSHDDYQGSVLSESAEDLDGLGELILVVDDEEEQRKIASDILRSLNYTVITAESGSAAIKHLSGSVADLVVLDMLMPPGINGLETYTKVIKTHPSQKAIIVSGYSESTDIKKALKLGVSQFLAKPYSRDQLAMAVKRVLAS